MEVEDETIDRSDYTQWNYHSKWRDNGLGRMYTYDWISSDRPSGSNQFRVTWTSQDGGRMDVHKVLVIGNDGRVKGHSKIHSKIKSPAEDVYQIETKLGSYDNHVRNVKVRYWLPMNKTYLDTQTFNVKFEWLTESSS